MACVTLTISTCHQNGYVLLSSLLRGAKCGIFVTHALHCRALKTQVASVLRQHAQANVGTSALTRGPIAAAHDKRVLTGPYLEACLWEHHRVRMQQALRGCSCCAVQQPLAWLMETLRPRRSGAHSHGVALAGGDVLEHTALSGPCWAYSDMYVHLS